MPRHPSDFQQLLNQRVEAFVSDITELARRHAIDTLARALQASSAGLEVAVPNGGRNGRAAAAGSRSGKRSAGELEQQASQLLRFIGENPGKRAEEIATQTGLSTKELVLPMRKLLAGKKVKTEGQKRATRYFLTGGGGGGAAAPKKSGRGKRKSA